VEIAGITAQRYTPLSSESYTVRFTVDGCAGALSDAYAFAVTGLLDLGNGRYIILYPYTLPEVSFLTFDRWLGSTVRTLRVRVKYNNGREVSRQLLNRCPSALKISTKSGVYHLELRWAEGVKSVVRVMSAWASG
jgi:hypothetical protein